MARTTETLLEQLRRLVPGDHASGEPLLAGFAGALRVAEQSTDTLRPLATIGGASGSWLTLQAHGYGLLRASGEPDPALRLRLRTVDDQVTVPALEAAVNAIIAPDVCRIVEWFDAPYLDDESETGMWLDHPDTRLSGGPNSFLVLIPRQRTGFAFGAFLDDAGAFGMWLDHPDTFLGEAAEDPKYDAIINEIERIRAAGTFWRLVLEGD